MTVIGRIGPSFVESKIRLYIILYNRFGNENGFFVSKKEYVQTDILEQYLE